MPAIVYQACGDEGAILDITNVKTVGTVTFRCPHCGYTWQVEFKRSTLNTMFGGFTWSLDDCTYPDGSPGAKYFWAYGNLECPSCSETFFLGIEIHETGAMVIYDTGGKPEYGWWEVRE